MSLGFQAYYWRDQPIENIHEWAKERGERMVKIKQTKKHMNPYTGKIREEVSFLEMPESFWNTMRIEGNVIMEEINE